MSDILMNKEQIMEIIPHRDPFLLIDEIIEMEVGVKVKSFPRLSRYPRRTYDRNACAGGCRMYAFKA